MPYDQDDHTIRSTSTFNDASSITPVARNLSGPPAVIPSTVSDEPTAVEQEHPYETIFLTKTMSCGISADLKRSTVLIERSLQEAKKAVFQFERALVEDRVAKLYGSTTISETELFKLGQQAQAILVYTESQLLRTERHVDTLEVALPNAAEEREMIETSVADDHHQKSIFRSVRKYACESGFLSDTSMRSEAKKGASSDNRACIPCWPEVADLIPPGLGAIRKAY